MTPTLLQAIGAALFGLALVHTFATGWLRRLALTQPRHAGLWHLLGEVELVFGFWAVVLVLCMGTLQGPRATIEQLSRLSFIEPLFIIVMLVVASSRPILVAARWLVEQAIRGMPLRAPLAGYLLMLSLLPLLGSLITEPAAMTLAALLLRERFFAEPRSPLFAYVTLAVLLVNISIGGVLTPYAAPPVLMVAAAWGWDLAFMASAFGWKAALAVVINAAAATMLLRGELLRMPAQEPTVERAALPLRVIAVHLLFLFAVVMSSHYPFILSALFIFFLGYARAYQQHQDALLLREGVLVGLFLAGLVVLGQQQIWWLQPLLGRIDSGLLFASAVGLTALIDNAALTYLGSLVQGLSDSAKYALVAGAVTGGGLTVIANAPNPIAFSILQRGFDGAAIRPVQLLLAALLPTAIAAACLLLPH